MENILTWDDAEESYAGCRCAKCGYGFAPGDAIARIRMSGDVIHLSCWDEFAADNADEFLERLR